MKSSQLGKEEWGWVAFENGFLTLKKDTGRDTSSFSGVSSMNGMPGSQQPHYDCEESYSQDEPILLRTTEQKNGKNLDFVNNVEPLKQPILE